MNRKCQFVMLIFLSLPLVSRAQSEKDVQAIHQTGENIRNAFAERDFETIKKHHHPEVIKALSYTHVLEGREAVMQDLKGTLKNFTLEFQQNDIESLWIEGDIAIGANGLCHQRNTPNRGRQLCI